MNRRLIIGLSSIVVGVPLVLASSAFFRDTVTVRNAVTGSPIAGAKVAPVYQSSNGAVYSTDEKGVARIGGFGLPRGASGYSVVVSADGYVSLTVPRMGAETRHLDAPLTPMAKP